MSEQELFEIQLLLKTIQHKYGYDFTNYAIASLKRRIESCLVESQLSCISDMIPKLLYDESFFQKFLKYMSVQVTEFFRDPEIYKQIKEIVIPALKTYPHIKIWHAGCATGEEVYSLSILLHEANIQNKTMIYATDFNEIALTSAKEGVFSLKGYEEAKNNYQLAGGEVNFNDYFNSKYGYIKVSDKLKNNIVFAKHNLVCDSSFGQMNMIICRNVLIYFNKKLQNKVLNLFTESLTYRGYLWLGYNEMIAHTPIAEKFDNSVNPLKIYRLKQTNEMPR